MLFPKKCAGCGQVGTYFCASCIGKTKYYFPQKCAVCERPSVDGVTHKNCKKGPVPDGLFSVWDYDFAVRQLIIKLKYKFVREMALSLSVPASSLLVNYKRSSPNTVVWKSEVILVPIPLHWSRFNWRGFNHVTEIAKIMSSILGWECTELLVRSKMTVSQVGLSIKKREDNVRGVFDVNPRLIVDKTSQIVLFDDVWTTGATMLEAVKMLKKAGFRRVWCLTLCA